MECKKIIERIYWETRTWPEANKIAKPFFESVMPDEIIKAMAEDDLRKSAALALYWSRPVTGEQLQSEMERMAKHTQRPELLKRIWAALDNDAFMIAECMARPILVERLIKNWYATGQRFHGALRARAERELMQFGRPGHMNQMSGEYMETVWVRAIKGGNRAKIERQTHTIILEEDEWTELMQKLPRKISKSTEGKSIDISSLLEGAISALQESRDSFYAMMVTETGNDRIKIASVAWKKEPFDTWWSGVKNELSVVLPPYAYKYSLPAIGEDPCIYDAG